MAKKNSTLRKFASLAEGLKAFGGPPPQHPLITVLNGIDSSVEFNPPAESHVLSYYKIAFRPNIGGLLRYGQTHFDYNEGGLFFAAPNQILAPDENQSNQSGCSGREAVILIHPDFLLSSALATKIKKYEFFSYAVNEALHLSDKEKQIILGLIRNIEEELNNRIDELSQDVVLAQIELLLNYAQRFYKRQFITRKAINSTLLEKFEQLLNDHFDDEKKSDKGIPTVQHLADRLAISPGYLSDMLRVLTGQNAQQHIHDKLIEKAKEKLSNNDLSVSEIAYELGFEHLQSFSKLFKNKTNQTPLKFRAGFN